MAANERSPDYPGFSFPEALNRTRLLYEREGRSPATREVIAIAIGYTAFSGAAKRAVAALRKYGLIAGRTEQYRVSDEARLVLSLPENDPERQQLIRRLAFQPDLFQEIVNHFGESNIPSNDNLTSFLVRRGYTLSAVRDIVKDFRATVEFVLEQTGSYSQGAVLDEDNANEVSERDAFGSGPNPQVLDQGEIPGKRAVVEKTRNDTHRLSFSMPNLFDIEISFAEAPTKESLEKAISVLKLAAEMMT